MMAVLLITFTLAFLVSFLARFAAENFLTTDRSAIIGSLVGLEHARNAGIAFGIDLSVWLLAILIPAAIILIAHLAWKLRDQKIPALSFGLILGGAAANIFDRFDDGFVTDFIQIGWWPTFNIADSCITIGVGILLLREFLTGRQKRHQGQ